MSDVLLPWQFFDIAIKQYCAFHLLSFPFISKTANITGNISKLNYKLKSFEKEDLHVISNLYKKNN